MDIDSIRERAARGLYAPNDVLVLLAYIDTLQQNVRIVEVEPPDAVAKAIERVKREQAAAAAKASAIAAAQAEVRAAEQPIPVPPKSDPVAAAKQRLKEALQ